MAAGKGSKGETMTVIVTSVMVLFVLVFIGYSIGKRGVVRKESAPDFSSLILNVTMPVTVFLAIISQTPAAVKSSLWIMLDMAVFHGAAFLFGAIVVKALHVSSESRGTWIYNCMFSNNGFMGLPLAYAIFGNQGLILMALANVTSNFLIFSAGTHLMTVGSGEKVHLGLRQIIFNNINLAVIAGFLFCLLRIPVPDAAGQLLNYLGNITSGLSMLVVGLSLSRQPFREVFTSRDTYVITALRLLAVPLLTIAVLKALPLSMNHVMYSTILLSAALPASAAQSMLAEQYHGDTEGAGRAVFMTTLCSLGTVPLIMAAGM